MQNNLINKVLRTIEKYNMLESGDKVLVAVSGGPDSMFLLQVLYRIGLDTPNQVQGSPHKLEIMVAHLNHCLRERADEEAEFVRSYCDRFGVPCIIEKQDVMGYCRRNALSLEEGARELRYEFLCRVADTYCMNKIATGHTADDQLETFILRVARGCGSKGLLLIPPKRGIGENIQVIRPLIEVRREEIREYLDNENIDYRIDESNYDCSNIRNYVRHQVVPKLEKIAPNFCANVVRLRDILEAEDAILDALTENRIREIRKAQPLYDGIELDLDGFMSTPLAIKRRILRKIQGFKSSRVQSYPTFDEVENAIRYIENSRGGKEFNFGDIKLIKSSGVIRITDSRLQITDYCVELPIPGEIEVNGYKIKSKIRNPKSKITRGDRSKEYFDFAKLEPPFFIRNMREGDKLKIKNQKSKICNKKLKSVFIDDKIPVWERRNIPLFVDGGGILWVVGKRRAHRALVGEQTSKIVEISSLNEKEQVRQ